MRGDPNPNQHHHSHACPSPSPYVLPLDFRHHQWRFKCIHQPSGRIRAWHVLCPIHPRLLRDAILSSGRWTRGVFAGDIGVTLGFGPQTHRYLRSADSATIDPDSRLNPPTSYPWTPLRLYEVFGGILFTYSPSHTDAPRMIRVRRATTGRHHRPSLRHINPFSNIYHCPAQGSEGHISINTS